jgi:hypothetical protein
MTKDTKPKGLVEKLVDTAKGAGAAASAMVDAAFGDERLANADEFAGRAEAHQAQVAAEDALADYERAKLAEVDGFSMLPENAALQLRFADGTTFVEGTFEVGRDDFKPSGFVGAETERATYEKPVEFELHAPPAQVTEAWLIAATGDAVRCAVGTVPLPVGGGHQAKIPAGYLLF